MWCKKGEYSAVASLFFSNPEDSVKSLFHSPISGFCLFLKLHLTKKSKTCIINDLNSDSYRPWTLLIFSIEYFLLTAWTFGLTVPAGVFIPAILCGAAWGRLVGVTIEHMIPNIVSSFFTFPLSLTFFLSLSLSLSLSHLLVWQSSNVCLVFNLPISRRASTRASTPWRAPLHSWEAWSE